MPENGVCEPEGNKQAGAHFFMAIYILGLPNFTKTRKQNSKHYRRK